MTTIAILTSGLWRLRGEIAALTSMTPVRWDRWPRPAVDAVAGWGHAPTANRARRLAARLAKPYFAFEDGPLRSVKPGPSQPPMSIVLDRNGIYYDATSASDLVAMISDRSWFTPAVEARAQAASERLRRLRLSKYNAGPYRSPAALGFSGGATRRVLVLDQVRDDASIRGALADADCFEGMLADALADDPAAEVVVKQHPDVLSGRRSGYFAEVPANDRIKVVAEQVNPWSLLEAVDTVYTVSSGLGFEAALAGKEVVCYGSPFYAGWGFTTDRRLKGRRPAAASAIQVFAAYYLRYARYFDAYRRSEIPFEVAAEQLAWLRDRFMDQSRRVVCYRIKRWKRRPVDRMLEGPAGRPFHARRIGSALRLAEHNRADIAAWSSRDHRKLQAACAKRKIPFVQIEDGFLRSVGLGASFVQPLSLVFDECGIYYDSRTPSGLERLLQDGELSSDVIERASRLRQAIIAAGATKYNVSAGADAGVASGGRTVVLVPGQVEDDASIERGAPAIKRNIELLEAVRSRHPDGYVVYKPHPDVEAGIRHGRVPLKIAERFADQVVTNASILALIAACDRVETITSLTGFEALMRGKAVATHGQPFYAGWGLTEDLCPTPQRTRQRSLDELVAAALILYPRYIDPLSGLPCGPELLVERLKAASSRKLTAGEKLVRVAGLSVARALHLGQAVRLALRGSP
jgi:capsular polysaccharide export protein